MKAVVVDLDGTLCNSKHREHLAQQGDWEEFHNRLAEDRPNEDVASLLDLIRNNEEIIVVFCTGRNERFRPKTVEWLIAQRILPDDLLMRPDGNYESDTVIKPKMLREWLAENGLKDTDVLMILEDRDKMVECWRNLGFNCWQCRASGY